MENENLVFYALDGDGDNFGSDMVADMVTIEAILVDIRDELVILRDEFQPFTSTWYSIGGSILSYAVVWIPLFFIVFFFYNMLKQFIER